MVRLLGMLFVALVLSTSGWASGLSSADVEGFVKSMQELKPLFDRYTEEMADDGDVTSTGQIVQDWANALREHAEVEGILEKYDLDAERFPSVAQLVTRAYMTLKLGKEGQDITARMEESLQDIDQNPDLPAEQKAEIRRQMEQSISELQKNFLNASEGDQDMVRPYLGQLDAIFEWREE